MVDVIAHRGLRFEKPENTLDSIEAALQLPDICGVEFDVELTRDLRPVVLHQETVVPNAEFSRVEPATRNFTSRDWVIEVTADEITRLDSGSWMATEFSDLRVPTFDQVLDLPWNSKIAFIELKDATYWGKPDESRPSKVVNAAIDSILRFPGAVNIISFNPAILSVVRDRAPEISTTLALWTEWRSRATDAIQVAKKCGAGTLSLPDIVLLEDPNWVRLAHQHEMKIHVYPVSPARGEPEFSDWTPASQVEKWKRLESIGVDAILSDFARETAAVLYT